MNAVPRVRTAGVVGAGRVGSVLGAALADLGFEIIGASGRSPAARARIAGLLPGVPRRKPKEITVEADLVVFAVPDDALAPLVAHLAESGGFRDGQVVAHTSGAHGVGILHPAVAKGARPLALHPAMTFTGRPEDVERLRKGISFGVTAPEDVRPFAEELVRNLDGTPEWVCEEHRALYHAALVHGANHLVTLVNEALDGLRAAGVVHPERVLDPLLHAALDNALKLGDAGLTGPVSRGDAGTVSRHLDTLAARAPDSLPGYLALARRTADRVIAAGRLRPAEAEPLLEALANREPADRETAK